MLQYKKSIFFKYYLFFNLLFFEYIKYQFV